MWRIAQIVEALDPTPATNAIVEATALLTLSSFAAQAGSIPGSIEEVKADWLRDCATAWDMAGALKLPDDNWMADL